MEPFQKHRGRVALLDRSNVDTDQIIPKQFLKKIDRVGYGQHLFHNWRYLSVQKPNADFSLNFPQYENASILLTRNNFGCGSSREHAVWALVQYGFRVIISENLPKAPAFADIFRNNSMKNGLLTIALAPKIIKNLFHRIKNEAPIEMTVDLVNQTLTLHQKNGDQIDAFDFPEAEKERLLKGLDDIALTLQYADQISAFEKQKGI